MADENDPQIAAIVADQRATDPRLEQQPAPEPDPAPDATSADGGASVEADASSDDPASAEPKPKVKKSGEEVLKGRVGHLTKQLSTKDAELARTQAELEAARRLLETQGRSPAPDGQQPTEPAPAAPAAPPRTDPNTGRVYTEAEVGALVVERAKADAFNKQADKVFDAGKGKFNDWVESVDMLNATGIMSQVFLDAAMATGDEATSAALIHHLGSDVEEAQRIAQLPPVRMAVELTKLAAQVATAPPAKISAAPAPVPSVRGSVNPTVDLAKAAEGDMDAYVAARAKQGYRWAQPKGQRARTT